MEGQGSNPLILTAEASQSAEAFLIRREGVVCWSQGVNEATPRAPSHSATAADPDCRNQMGQEIINQTLLHIPTVQTTQTHRHMSMYNYKQKLSEAQMIEIIHYAERTQRKSLQHRRLVPDILLD